MSGLFQGGNIFAALSQGQNDEDEDSDLDEDDTPAEKVQFSSTWVKGQELRILSVWVSL